MMKARVYRIGRVRIANFGFQFSGWLRWNSWRAFGFGKRNAWTVIVL
jgi:hypothetical protein